MVATLLPSSDYDISRRLHNVSLPYTGSNLIHLLDEHIWRLQVKWSGPIQLLYFLGCTHLKAVSYKWSEMGPYSFFSCWIDTFKGSKQSEVDHKASSFSWCTYLKAASCRLHLPRGLVALEPLEWLAEGEEPFCLPPLVRGYPSCDSDISRRLQKVSLQCSGSTSLHLLDEHIWRL